MSLNPTNSWSQIDGTLWLRFIAKGASGLQNSTLSNNGSQRPCYDSNFKKGCFRRNCIYRHNCMKCGAIHPAVLCNQFFKKNSNAQLNARKSTNSYLQNSQRAAAVNLNIRPPLLGNGPQNKQYTFFQVTDSMFGNLGVHQLNSMSLKNA